MLTETSKAKISAEQPKTIGGLLLSALEMEDAIAGGVYEEYMLRSNWPARLKDETFEGVQMLLKILIDDTRRHRNMITDIKSRIERQ
jgi:hypothetical protein